MMKLIIAFLLMALSSVLMAEESASLRDDFIFCYKDFRKTLLESNAFLKYDFSTDYFLKDQRALSPVAIELLVSVCLFLNPSAKKFYQSESLEKLLRNDFSEMFKEKRNSSDRFFIIWLLARNDPRFSKQLGEIVIIELLDLIRRESMALNLDEDVRSIIKGQFRQIQLEDHSLRFNSLRGMAIEGKADLKYASDIFDTLDIGLLLSKLVHELAHLNERAIALRTKIVLTKEDVLYLAIDDEFQAYCAEKKFLAAWEAYRYDVLVNLDLGILWDEFRSRQYKYFTQEQRYIVPDERRELIAMIIERLQ